MTTEDISKRYINDPKTRVFIHHNDDTGVWKFSVEVVDSGGFWFDSFDEEKDAISYIAQNGLVTAV